MTEIEAGGLVNRGTPTHNAGTVPKERMTWHETVSGGNRECDDCGRVIYMGERWYCGEFRNPQSPIWHSCTTCYPKRTDKDAALLEPTQVPTKAERERTEVWRDIHDVLWPRLTAAQREERAQQITAMVNANLEATGLPFLTKAQVDDLHRKITDQVRRNLEREADTA